MRDHLGDFREESSVSTWILRIATNHALKLLHRRRGLPTVSIDAPAGDEADSYATLPHPEFIAQWRDEPSRRAQQREVRQLIETALAELPEKYRVVFVLRGFALDDLVPARIITGDLERLFDLLRCAVHRKLAERDEDELHAEAVGVFDRQLQVLGPRALVLLRLRRIERSNRRCRCIRRPAVPL